MKKRSDFYLATGFISPVMNVLDALACCVFCVALVLKLTDALDWSWLWVLSPLWIAAAFHLLCSLATTAFFKALKHQSSDSLTPA